MANVYVYKGGEYEGVTIVDYGLALNVAKGRGEVEYNSQTSDYYAVLRDGAIAGRTKSIKLDKEQLAWLEENQAWVKSEIEKCSDGKA